MSDGQQRLPNLYQLLGLTALEDNRDKIDAALKRAQAKVQSLKQSNGRPEDIARLQKVIALGQKYLLTSENKAAYDTQWTACYGESANKSAAVSTKASSASLGASSAKAGTQAAAAVAETAPSVSDQLAWDMSTLEALLPAADPHSPFQMAEYLRTSQVRDPMAAEADLRKLIALLGGEDLPEAQPVISQPIHLQLALEGNARSEDVVVAEPEPMVEPGDTGIIMPRSSSSTAAIGLAKRMRKKRQQAILFGGIVLVAGVGGLFLLNLYLNKPAKPAPELAQATPPKRPSNKATETKTTENKSTENKATSEDNPGDNINLGGGSLGTPGGLIQPGQNVKPLEIQATPIDPAMGTPGEPAKEPMQPAPMQPAPMQPTPPTANQTEPAKPEPPKPDPAKPTPDPNAPADKPATDKPATDKPAMDKPAADKPAKPDTKAEPAADVKLTGKDKKVWQDSMKQARMALAKLDPASSEKQMAALKPLAKTAQQQAQHATLEQAVGLIRTAREAIVAGIKGLKSGDTFTVGSSTMVSFIEGDETRIIVFVLGKRQEFKLEAMPVGMGMALMKLEPNVIDNNLTAAMGAYVMVHPKATQAALTQAKTSLEETAAAGAISKELSTFYDEDYKVQ